MAECTCKGSIYKGHAPHKNMTYVLLLQTGRDKNLSERLLKDGKHDFYKLLIDGKIDELCRKLLEEVPLCPEHADCSIFVENRK